MRNKPPTVKALALPLRQAAALMPGLALGLAAAILTWALLAAPL
jgi:hypothetical protein